MGDQLAWAPALGLVALMLDEGVEALDALGAFVDSWLSAVDSARTA